MKKTTVLALAFCLLAALLTSSMLPVVLAADEKITISSAKADTPYGYIQNGVNAAGAECAVENLRPAGGLWCNLSVLYEAAADSIAQAGERYITLGLSENADISKLRIQWYQGGSSATDITDEKQRTYMFLIQASSEATGDDNFVDIYGSYTKNEYKLSGTGSDFEEYACTFSGAKRIRIWSVGNDGGADSDGAYNVGIRNIEVYGTGLGGEGANSSDSGESSAGSTSDEKKITIASIVADTPSQTSVSTGAECAVENLRPADGLWCNLSTTYEAGEDSIAQTGERYITLSLSETADISKLRIQWYQGGSSATNITGEKQRTYIFLIQASAEATGDDNFVDIYGNYNSGDYKCSGTGSDFEEYACTFSGAKRIRIWSVGNDGGVDAMGAYNMAIRNIEVYGTGLSAEDTNSGDNTQTDNEESATSPASGDCDGDGKITLADLALLSKYLAGWDVVLS